MPLEGATDGAPGAVQVADRWHLWHNLAGAVERAVARHKSCLQEPPEDPGPGPQPPPASTGPAAETGTASRTRARHEQVHAALARGLTITSVSRTLGLDRKTVRRYATAATPDQLTGGTRLARPGLLDPHQAYLRQRWDDGVRSTTQLHQELRARGYTGSLRTLAGSPPSYAATPTSPRHRRRPRPRKSSAGSSPRPANSATMTAPRRIEMLKRQMYGRAKPDLLRKRVLLAD